MFVLGEQYIFCFRLSHIPLKRMVFGIEGIRPALLSDDSFRVLDELRAFRHVFRHAYSHGLDQERIVVLVNKMKSSRSIIENDLASFRRTVTSI